MEQNPKQKKVKVRGRKEQLKRKVVVFSIGKVVFLHLSSTAAFVLHCWFLYLHFIHVQYVWPFRLVVFTFCLYFHNSIRHKKCIWDQNNSSEVFKQSSGIYRICSITAFSMLLHFTITFSSSLFVLSIGFTCNIKAWLLSTSLAFPFHSVPFPLSFSCISIVSVSLVGLSPSLRSYPASPLIPSIYQSLSRLHFTFLLPLYRKDIHEK